MKHNLIASGYIKNTKDLKVMASVYVEESEASSESAADAVKHVVLKFKNYNAAELPSAPVTFDDIADEVGSAMTVPGFNGTAAVTIEAPVSISHTRTKAFEHEVDGAVKNCVFVDIRYEY